MAIILAALAVVYGSWAILWYIFAWKPHKEEERISRLYAERIAAAVMKRYQIIELTRKEEAETKAGEGDTARN